MYNHQEYTRLFDKTLKPKHHFMIHYPTIIAKCGPPRFFSCFLFEAMHKHFKMYCRPNMSRVNVAVSITAKYQFRFAHQLISPRKSLLVVDNAYLVRSVSAYSKVIGNSQSRSFTQCTYRGTQYKIGFHLVQYLDEYQPELCQVYEIREIAVFEGCDMPHLVCIQCKVQGFSQHYLSIEIDAGKYVGIERIISGDALVGPPLNVNRINNTNNYIRPKFYH